MSSNKYDIAVQSAEELLLDLPGAPSSNEPSVAEKIGTTIIDTATGAAGELTKGLFLATLTIANGVCGIGVAIIKKGGKRND